MSDAVTRYIKQRVVTAKLMHIFGDTSSLLVTRDLVFGQQLGGSPRSTQVSCGQDTGHSCLDRYLLPVIIRIGPAFRQGLCPGHIGILQELADDLVVEVHYIPDHQLLFIGLDEIGEIVDPVLADKMPLPAVNICSCTGSL
ncbi:hypothetical protein, partial [Aeromonas sobria]|uniref:hypothetical protein n=1 Tax=Aeromonas sobria TaxID=646 RepID=UPI0019D687BA